ncbi:hypothetical protein BpHYR1_050598 [Brachionus plicatilis]|uniref:Transmembrane protein n=1 Tax=Brachionus plicatilis TaxID=10195 RepID=A0A3M7SVC0_BRAPC|nr:hypothetical protein BpHYR1_050598 [Brachionus plicatilis]
MPAKTLQNRIETNFTTPLKPFKLKRRKKNLKIKKSKKIFIQEKFFDFEIFFSSLKNFIWACVNRFRYLSRSTYFWLFNNTLIFLHISLCVKICFLVVMSRFLVCIYGLRQFK